MAYWDASYPDLSPKERAEVRIRDAIRHARVAGVAAATGATTATLVAAATDGAASPIALPLGLACVGVHTLYVAVLQVDLAFDLASIYGCPFSEDDVGEIGTLIALALDVELPTAELARDDAARPRVSSALPAK